MRQARTAEAPVPGRGASWAHLAHTIRLGSEAVAPLHARHGDTGYTDAYAAVSPGAGVLDTLILPRVNGECLQMFVDEIGVRHGEAHVRMVVDGAGWHRNQELRLPRNLPLLFLPPYAPARTPVEPLWDDWRETSFHNRVFDRLDSLDAHLEQARADFEQSPHRTREITGWPWIMNALSN